MQLTMASRAHISTQASMTVSGFFRAIIGWPAGPASTFELPPCPPFLDDPNVCPPHPPSDAMSHTTSEPPQHLPIRGWYSTRAMKSGHPGHSLWDARAFLAPAIANIFEELRISAALREGGPWRTGNG